ncbi:alpha/beta fold hydrolase [Kaistia soli]|uniref:alpha/beta fold hydrolase n=1 Tax=Kaistia soli TaxID=446684 RepID=UPI0009329452|nr:hypothetical protein [Kaistia soli]
MDQLIDVCALTSIMSSTGNPSLPSVAPDAMAMMTHPTPDLALDEAGFIAHCVAFARRIAGSSYPLDEEEYRVLIGAELCRGYVQGGFGRQGAAMALAGDRRVRLSTIRAPTLVIHGTEDALIPLACGCDTTASIPGAEWLPIPGMGHDPPPSLYRTVGDAIGQTARRSAMTVS